MTFKLEYGLLRDPFTGRIINFLTPAQMNTTFFKPEELFGTETPDLVLEDLRQITKYFQNGMATNSAIRFAGPETKLEPQTEAGKYYLDQIVEHCRELNVEGNGVGLIKAQLAENLFYSLSNAKQLLLLQAQSTKVNDESVEEKKASPSLRFM